MNFLDSKIGATDYLKDKAWEGRSLLEEVWENVVIESLGRKYYQLEKTIEWNFLRRMNLGM